MPYSLYDFIVNDARFASEQQRDNMSIKQKEIVRQAIADGLKAGSDSDSIRTLLAQEELKNRG